MIPRLFALLLALAAAPALAQVTLLAQWAATPTANLPAFGADQGPGGRWATEDFTTASSVLVSQIDFLGEWPVEAVFLGTLTFRVQFHPDNAGALDNTTTLAAPTATVADETILLSQGLPSPRSIASITLDLSPAVALPAGTYWVAFQDFSSTDNGEMRAHPADAFDAVRGRVGAGQFSPFPAWLAVPAANIAVRLRGALTPVELLEVSVE